MAFKELEISIFSTMTKTIKFATIAATLLMVALAGCKGKTNGSVRLLESMETDGQTIKFEYDNQNRIVKMYSYEGSERVETRTITYNGNDVVAVEYDVEDHLNMSFKRNGNAIHVTDFDFWYTITVSDEGYIIDRKSDHPTAGSRISNYQYQSGNVTSISGVSKNTEGTVTKWARALSYDNKKSPFYYCNTPIWFMQIIFHNTKQNNVTADKVAEGPTTHESQVDNAYQYDKYDFPVKQTSTERVMYGYQDDMVRTRVTKFTYRGAVEAEIDTFGKLTQQVSGYTGGQQHRTDDITVLMKQEAIFLGMIGDESRKMGIAFLNVARTGDKQYEVTGKSKVRDNVCDFRGTMEVLSAKVDIVTSDGIDYFDGAITGKYLFEEDKNQSGTGVFSGFFEIVWNNENLSTYFTSIAHDHVEFNVGATFAGTWISYRTGATRKACWGNLPACIPCCINDGQELQIAEKYRSSGWFDDDSEWIGWWK
ncbi:MAG: hypothetical protein LBU89_10125 [Fibromonadaceae bacterium]|jgi:YD repeat-containing protein|nr:hypothetical protein [Fibromonadaceae bacterium]